MSDTRILFGFHAVLSRMRQHPASVQEILIDRDRVDARMKDLLSLADGAGVRHMQVERARLDGMAGANGRHQGVRTAKGTIPSAFDAINAMDARDALNATDAMDAI